MECKNCSLALSENDSYCMACGAKVIRNRLTFKNLSADFIDRLLDLDNTFLLTFKHLFTKPEVVIDGYINGVRKKYMNPVSYIGIALTLSGLFLILMRKVFIDKIDYGSLSGGLNPEVMKKIMTVTMDFNSFIYLLYIPIIALAGWLVLNTKQYLVSEYLVASIYSLAHFSILSFPISLAILIFFPENYLSFSYPIILIMALYTAYVLNRIHGRNILRTLVYFLLFSIGFFGLGLLLNIILLLTGVITIQELMPKA